MFSEQQQNHEKDKICNEYRINWYKDRYFQLAEEVNEVVLYSPLYQMLYIPIFLAVLLDLES